MKTCSDTRQPCRLGKRRSTLWWNGPEWLSDPALWPPQIVTAATPETEAETKTVKQVFGLAVEQRDEMDIMLSRTTAWRTLRIGAWISGFIFNAKRKYNERLKGPLTTDEIEAQRTYLEKRVQIQHAGLDKFKDDQLKLNLQLNSDGILVCHGRIQGVYPIYLPDTSAYAEKIVAEAHKNTLHGELV